MAPELMRGEPATPSSDLYSAGMVLRDCLATEAERGAAAILAERLSDPDPWRRPASADAALAELHGGRPAPAEPATDVLEGPPADIAPSPARTRARAPGAARLAALGGLVAVGLVVAAIASSDGGEPGPALDGLRTSSDASNRDRGSAGSGAPSGESASPRAGTDGGQEQSGGIEPSSSPDPARGAALNDQGYSLLQSGNADDAVPILRRAVASFPEGTGDLNYAYALFNLASALRQSGHPAEAIPLLRERLRVPNQSAAVRSELNAARAAVEGSGQPEED
jgi:tetratricopeptide (TPR) repeat protein